MTFLACLVLLLAAMGWVSWNTLALEEAREKAAQDADVQERVRLALWRLDFQASSLMIRENARPPHDFRAFYAQEGVVGKDSGLIKKGDVMAASPLLAEAPEHVLLHFQMDAHGEVRSPQVPENGERDVALTLFVNETEVKRSEERLKSLRELLSKPAAVEMIKQDWRSAGRRQEAPTPSKLNRQILAEMACVVPFEENKNLLALNDANTPRNPTWAAQQNVTSVPQTLLNSNENAVRSRAYNNLSEKAVEQQTMKMKTQAMPVDDVKLLADKAAAKPSLQRMEKKLDEQAAATSSASPVPLPAAASSAEKPAASVAAAPVTAEGKQMPSLALNTPLAMRAVSDADALRRTDPADSFAALAKEGVKTVNVAGKSSRPFQGVWLGDHLVLTREAWVDGVRMVQGVWLDWPTMREAWLREITDLFPKADLEPGVNATAGARPMDDRLRFAALPVRLVQGQMAVPALAFWTPLRKSLAVALSCVLLAAAAVGLVLYGTVALSERRAAFVSAVTHELRTPLTTFRLYSEMLADGMVKDEAQKKTYLETLSGEAGRLSHLVENVLAYARLERGSAKVRAERVTIGELLERILPRLKQRADDGGMEIRMDVSESDAKTPLHIDAGAVEQILFNLVDNACKYAAPRAAERVIHVEADTRGKFAMLRVRDHGGGIARRERLRIFHPFHKSADEAAHSAPGVGLGLALCQRLAVALGGALTLDAGWKEGACFVLRVPKMS